MPKSDIFCFKPEKKRILTFRNGRNQKRGPIRKNNLFHFSQLSDSFFYILPPSAPLPRILHRSCDSQKFENYKTDLTTEMTNARKISKNRFLRPGAGWKVENLACARLKSVNGQPIAGYQTRQEEKNKHLNTKKI